MPIELRVFLAMLGGFLLGEGFIWWMVIMPLTKNERLYLRSFYTALKAGEYDVTKEDDDAED